MNDQLCKLKQVSKRLDQAWGRAPTPEELATEMEAGPEKIRWMLQASRCSILLKSPLGHEQDRKLGDTLRDEEAPLPAEMTDRHLLRQKRNELILTLPPREAKMLQLHFGL